MHTNLRRLRKRSPTKRGRCRLCSVPAGHGGQAWHVRFACGMTAAQFTRNDPRRANATLGASGRNVREPPWSGRPTFSSASGQDLRRRANSEMYHGFTIDLLVELVRSELATAQAERVVAGGRAMEIARVRITDAGRRALAKDC
jgi:hypothetical protein